MHRYLDLLRRYLGPQRGRVIILAMMLAATTGLQLLGPQLLRRLIDAAQHEATETMLMDFALAFLVVMLFKQALTPAAAWVSDTMAWTATNALREDLVLHCLRLDQSFHNAYTPGQLIERIDGDPSALSGFFSQFVLRMIGSGLLLLGALIVLLLQEVWMGLALSGFTLTALLVLRRIQGIAVPYYKAYRKQIAEVTGFIEERVMGAEDIRGNGAVPFVVRRLAQLYGVLARKSLSATVISRVTQSVLELMIALGTVLVLVVGAYLLQAQAISLGAIYLVVAYTDIIARNLNELTAQLDSFQAARAALDRIDELRNRKSVLSDGDQSLPDALPLALRFDTVGFAYPNGPPVLKDISFGLEAGQRLGVLGRTGSGKTTLGRLISRFYDVSDGAIQLQGCDVRAVRRENLRQRVGVVTQEVQIFQGSVRENLTFWDEGVSDNRIHVALEQLGLRLWLQRLPNGLDTQLAHGSGLSAGEAQLVALARVFLQNPGLIILDEASARVDPGTEQLIETALDRLLRDRTAIIIAHRLSTLAQVDRILVLENGQVIEQGARMALANDPTSRFAQLLKVGLTTLPAEVAP